MLSTAYRVKLESICSKIAKGEPVELSEIIWADKLGKVNTTAATMIRQARRKSMNQDMVEGSMDDFLNQLDLGDPDPTQHKTGFNSVDEIVDFFKRNDVDDEGKENWLRRD